MLNRWYPIQCRHLPQKPSETSHFLVHISPNTYSLVSAALFVPDLSSFNHNSRHDNSRRLCFGGGFIATLVDSYKPDLAFVRYGDETGVGPNRCDLRVSWKWDSTWQMTQVPYLLKEYKKVLAQLKFYMKQHHARYGFIITDTELVAVRRMPKDSHLAVTDAISWTRQRHGQLTILLGLWYLGMLAAGSDWHL